MKNINEEHALTAMCIWESLISTYLTKNSASNTYQKKLHEVGLCEMRSIVLNVLAPSVELAYETLSGEFDYPFDIEFVPSFLSHAEPFLTQKTFFISGQHSLEIASRIANHDLSG